MSLDIEKALTLVRLVWPDGIAVHNYERALRTIALLNGGMAELAEPVKPPPEPAVLETFSAKDGAQWEISAKPVNGALSRNARKALAALTEAPRTDDELASITGISRVSGNLSRVRGELARAGYRIGKTKRPRRGRRAKFGRKNAWVYSLEGRP